MTNGIHFEDNEEIIYTARKHWFIFTGETFFISLLALAPLIILIIPENVRLVITEASRFGGNVTALFLMSWVAWVLILWVVFIMLWTDYYLDVWYVTNHRIVDVEQRGLFSRSISSFRFDQIQDVTVEVPGFLATIIDFGTVKIRTASEETFKFKGVALPNLLKEKVMTEHHRVHDDSRGGSHQEVEFSRQRLDISRLID